VPVLRGLDSRLGLRPLNRGAGGHGTVSVTVGRGRGLSKPYCVATTQLNPS
jgi:hypothetical protein